MKKFCCVPWQEIFIDPSENYGLCCKQNDAELKEKTSVDKDYTVHWNSDFMKQIRKDFVQGKQINICNKCWNEESLGMESTRMSRNLRYLGSKDPDHNDNAVIELINNTAKDGHYQESPKGVLVSTGNLCQLRCISCSPSYSRSILKDYEKLGWSNNFKTRLSSFGTQNLQIKQFENLKKITHTLNWLHVSGGEPSLSKELIEYLEWCEAKNFAKNINLIVITNGVNVKERFMNAIKKFKMVIMQVSVDGHGQLDEYLRSPTNWNKKEKFINYCRKHFEKFTVHTVAYALNVNKLHTLIDYCLDKKINHSIECIEYPNNLCVENLPQTMKDQAIADLEKYTLLNNETLNTAVHKVISRLKLKGNLANLQEIQNIVSSYDKIRSYKLSELNNAFSKINDQ